jgi:hypothetical protein
MNCLAKPTQQTGEPEAPARASVPERFRRLKRNEVVWSGDFVADERLGFELWEAPDVFRAGSFAGARASAPFLENHNLPYEDRDIINNPFNYTEILEKSGQSLSPCVEVNGHMPGRCQRGRSGSLPARKPACCIDLPPSPMRRPTGLATRIIMSNAWQDPGVPARSATIKPTQAIWQNSSR